MSKAKILIIEDERSLIDILSYNLSREGFDVATSSDGAEGLRRAQATVPDLVLLDLMLPGLDGLQICRQLRSDPKTQGIRILMLTAKSEEVDEIVGFNMGADDYVAKPFKIKPLISRIKALLRRPSAEPAASEVLSVAGIEVDRTLHTAKLDGEEMLLTPTEFKMLWTMMRRPGRPYSRNELLDNARGEDANALERTIDVHVRSLRQKLGDRGNLIETVRGIGYRFKAE
jgi:two-component system phosphate regulon response regulator PhoB